MPGQEVFSLLIFLLPILLLVFLFRTQRRRQREVEGFQAQLAVGQEVMTTSGMHGRIVAVAPTVVDLEISPGVTVQFDRRAIGTQVPAPAAEPTPPTDTTQD